MELDIFLKIVKSNPVLPETKKQEIFAQAPFMFRSERLSIAKMLKLSEAEYKKLEATNNTELENISKELDTLERQEIPKMIKDYETKLHNKEVSEIEDIINDL